jgi:translation initiation factor 3 subunit E
MAHYFDIHMIIPLLDFLNEVKLYDHKAITKEKIKSILSTNMIELVEDEYERLVGDIEMDAAFKSQKETLEKRKVEIFDLLDNEPENVKIIREFFSNESQISDLKNNANLSIDYLEKTFGITSEALENYYKYSKFKYECGYYKEAADMLGNYLSVFQSQCSSVLGALWGRLSCRILQASWEESLLDFVAVKDAIETRNISAVDQIRQRAWLLHWSLFVFSNQRDGHDSHYEFFSEKIYIQTIENLCPWMLRYYSLSIIIGNKKKTMMKELLNEIQSLSHLYSDPITEFVEALYDRYDFNEALVKLKESHEILKHDFFMQIHADKFMHEAKLLICEVYCSINRRVDLKTLSEKIELTEEQTEKWMVEMIQKSSLNSNLQAHIDSSEKQVIISPPIKLGQQIVVEKTRDLTSRSSILQANIENLLQEQSFYLKNRN